MAKKLLITIFLTLIFGSYFHAEASPLVLVFQAPASSGYSSWNSAGNITTYNSWLAAIGETPDFGEDWDGKDWQGNNWVDGKIFDTINVPTAIFADGVTFTNAGSTENKYRARANDAPGSTNSIDKYSWDIYEDFKGTVRFPNGVDYLGFYIFDTDHDSPDVKYTLYMSDGSIFKYSGLATDERKYRFIGFVNNTLTAKITKLEIYSPKASHYGVDELKWGRNTTPPPQDPVVPEPSSLLLIGSGLAGAFKLRKKKTT